MRAVRKRLTGFQRVVLATWVALVILIFMGAIVRATGAGLGCPDWPTCWGNWIPPTSVDQVDFEKIDLERFRKKAERLGNDPNTLTEDFLRQQFNPVHVWTEYVNRLTSMPLGIFSLWLAALGVGQWRRRRPVVAISAWLSLAIVLINAWLGRMVVLSGLRPGIITLHMALAILMLCLLVYAGWRGCEDPWRLRMRPDHDQHRRRVYLFVILLAFLTVFEGLMGSQVREMTDALAKRYADMPRAHWTAELEHSWMYLVHRSFSWLVLGAAIGFYLSAQRALTKGCRWLEKLILGLILAQMFLGLILANVGILAIAQIFHIGLSSILVSALALWILGNRHSRKDIASSPI